MIHEPSSDAPKKQITGTLENWYLEDVGGGSWRFHGNIFNDAKRRFPNGESIRTSRFTPDRNPKTYKDGDVVNTMFSTYQLGKPLTLSTEAQP